jgi:hypothetical protein
MTTFSTPINGSHNSIVTEGLGLNARSALFMGPETAPEGQLLENSSEAEFQPSNAGPDPFMGALDVDCTPPPLNQRLINVLAAGGDSSALQDVRRHHQSLFDRRLGFEEKLLQSELAKRTANVAGRQRKLKQLTQELEKLPVLISVNPDAADKDGETPQPKPWSLSDKVELAMFYGGATLAMAMGVYNTANILNSSGEQAFGSYTQALGAAFPLVLVAVAAKGIRHLLPKIQYRRIAAWLTLVPAFAGITYWAANISQILGQASQPITLDTSLSDSAANPAVMGIFIGGCIADLAAAVACFLLAGILLEEHARNRLLPNPNRAPLQVQLDEEHAHLSKEQRLLSLIDSKAAQLRAARAEFISNAEATFAAAKTMMAQLS